MRRGNPLNLVDPTGHDTSKPSWWPPYLPYTYDLPDELSYDAFVEWADENNSPTAFSNQVGVDFTAGAFLHGSFGVEVQLTFNWLSGELMWSGSSSAGARGGTPVNGVGGHAGMSAHYRASTMRQLPDASLFAAVDGEADFGVRVGGQASFSRAVEYADANGNNRFDLVDGEGAYFSAVVDPVFSAPIDSLSANLAGGFDVTPNGIEGGFSAGVSDMDRWVQIDLYAPVRRIYDWTGGHRE